MSECHLQRKPRLPHRRCRLPHRRCRAHRATICPQYSAFGCRNGSLCERFGTTTNCAPAPQNPWSSSAMRTGKEPVLRPLHHQHRNPACPQPHLRVPHRRHHELEHPGKPHADRRLPQRRETPRTAPAGPPAPSPQSPPPLRYPEKSRGPQPAAALSAPQESERPQSRPARSGPY
jgi:hypothetical protein